MREDYLRDRRVALVRCETYDTDKVTDAVRQAVDLLGGIRKFIKPGGRIFLKPNLIMPRRPDAAATTHPAVVKAVALLVREAGGTPVIGDSPGGPFVPANVNTNYRVTGMDAVAAETGAELNSDFGTVSVKLPEGRIVKSIMLAKGMVEADAIISLPKLKTHSLTVFTGAVKNMFGAVPGIHKAEYHLNMTRVSDFSDMLVDVVLATKPVLTLMDGIVGMEGRGPTAGKPKPAGIILASRSPFALDVAACRIAGIPLSRVPTITAADSRGFMPADINALEIIGDTLDSLKLESFVLPEAYPTSLQGVPLWLRKLLKAAIQPKPVFNREMCTGCGTCEENCPPKAIRMKDGRPGADMRKCIRCFCCQELCPNSAVTVAYPWLGKVLIR